MIRFGGDVCEYNEYVEFDFIWRKLSRKYVVFEFNRELFKDFKCFVL